MEINIVALVILALLINGSVCYYDYDDEIVAVELELTDLDLGDESEKVSISTKHAYLGAPNGYEEKISAELHLAEILRPSVEKNSDFSYIPTELYRNWTLLTKPGDVLLPQERWKTLVTFRNNIEEETFKAEVPCINNTNNCTFNKQDLLDTLATTRNVTILQATWSAWQKSLESNNNTSKFEEVLQLVNEAADANSEDNAEAYWEMLSESSGGYFSAKILWEQIEPLYKKLHNFVKVRLYKYYNITESGEQMPVYLLGSNFGNDWSNIAEIVAPHPQILYETVSELRNKTLKDAYALAESMTKRMGLGSLRKKFWTNSNFNLPICEPRLLSYYDEKYTELFSCNKLDLSAYLDTHETALKIVLRNEDYQSLMRRGFRFSAIDEALANIGSIFAIDNLPLYGILQKDVFNKTDEKTYNDRMTALLVTALRVLPKLSYYLAADSWRLDELQNPTGNVSQSWWNTRQKLQNIKGVNNMESDFLGDADVISNRPVLSKFFGAILQFQLLAYYRVNWYDVNYDLMTSIGKNPDDFLSFVQDRPNKDWPYLLTYFYNIDEVSTNDLLEYFKPLEEYMEHASLEQATINKNFKQRDTKPLAPPEKSTKSPHKSVKAIPEVKENDTTVTPVQNDQQQEQEKDVKPDNEKTTQESTSVIVNEVEEPKQNKTGIYIGTGVTISVVSIITILFVRHRLKIKRRNENRRYGA